MQPRLGAIWKPSKKCWAGNKKICAVIKGDAYGNSIELLMPQIIKHKIPCVGITSNDEARVVRASGYKGTVARLRTTTLGEIEDGFQYNIEELFGNLKAAQLADAAAAKRGKKLNIHLALNAGGMDRKAWHWTPNRAKPMRWRLPSCRI